MTSSILLTMALSLLMAAQQPNVPESLKNAAVDVANSAIVAAMEDIQASSPEAPQPEKAAESTPSTYARMLSENNGQMPKEIPMSVMTTIPEYVEGSQFQFIGEWTYRFDGKTKFIRQGFGG